MLAIFKGVRFADETNKENLPLEVICAYLKVLLIYPKAFNSSACKDVFHQIEMFEELYFEFLLGNLKKEYIEVNDAQWKILMATKVKLNIAIAGENKDVYQTMDINHIRAFARASSDGVIDDLDIVHQDRFKNRFIHSLELISQMIKQPLNAINDNFVVNTKIQ